MDHKDTAVLTIDVQVDVLDSIVPTGRAVLPAIARTLSECRARGVPIIHVHYEHRPDGSDVPRFRLPRFREKPFLVKGSPGAELVPELEARPDEIRVPKQRFSAFFQTDLLMILMRLGIRTVVLVGLQTPNCIRCTATDADSYDFDVVLLADAITAGTPQVHQANLEDLANMGMRIMTVTNFIAELT
ncbi:MAG: isochorismatase family cysteine hydrolase [Actinomycetes bacterium]